MKTAAVGAPVLALDTSADLGSVAIGVAGELRAETQLRVGGGHSGALIPALDYVVRAAGFAPADIAAIIVGGGPGSFTGLRIAAATAKGIAHRRDLPLWAFSSLQATAAGVAAAGSYVCALFDARRGDVFAACYQFDPAGIMTEIIAPAALPLSELLGELHELRPLVFAGEGAAVHRTELLAGGDVRVAPAAVTASRAAALLWLHSANPARGRVEDVRGWEPEYLRASGAERIAAARAGT